MPTACTTVFWDYPHQLRTTRAFDLYHIIDHTYSHLAHGLPPGRTVVTCHDLDAFRSLLEPKQEKRSLPFRQMAKRILTGFQKAARVVCDTTAVRDALISNNVVAPDRLVTVPLGVDSLFSAGTDDAADAELLALLGDTYSTHFRLLHVGSTVPRKRVDSLLRILADVRKKFPKVVLARVGGDFNREQEQMIRDLSLGRHIVVLPFITRRVLASAYRWANIVVQPSEAEGFGLPVVEAMACGRP